MTGLELNFKSALNKKMSFLHKMNPSLKIMCVIFLLIITFLPTGIFGQIILFAVVVTLWSCCRLPGRKIANIVKTMLVMLAIIFVINWATYKMPATVFDLQANHLLIGGSWEVLAQAGQIKSFVLPDGSIHYWNSGVLWGGSVATNLTLIKPESGQYVEGLLGGQKVYLIYSSTWYCLSSQVVITSISITFKIFLMLTIISMLTNTTSTIQLTFGIEDLLHPLKYIKVPVTEVATIISVAIRFVPNLLDEAKRIMSTQASRGLDFRNGHFIMKCKAIISLLVPMFSVAFKKADQLSDSMEARNFNPRLNRTRYRKFPIKAWDWIFFGFVVILCTILICFVAWKVLIPSLIVIDCFLV